MTKKVVEINVFKGDITERETDAIINTSNDRLILGSGLGGAIRAKGGETIVAACAQFGPLSLGKAVLTTAGNLKTGYIIHAVLSSFDGAIEAENISKSLYASLSLANKHQFTSIAIPDMSVGIIPFSPNTAAERVFQTLRQFLTTENRTLQLIEVVVWDIETLHIYQDAYRQIFFQGDA